MEPKYRDEIEKLRSLAYVPDEDGEPDETYTWREEAEGFQDFADKCYGALIAIKAANINEHGEVANSKIDSILKEFKI